MSHHELYRTADPDAPDQIKDRNGDVVLALCRICGRAEIEPEEPCSIRGKSEIAIANSHDRNGKSAVNLDDWIKHEGRLIG